MSFILIGISAVIVFSFLDDILILIAKNSTSYVLNNRINTFLLYMRGGTIGGDLLIRKDLYINSIQAFLRNPIFGEFFRFGKRSAGGHSQILDLLANTGIVGAIIILTIVRQIKKWPSVSMIEIDKYRKLQIILAVVIAILNTFSAPEMFLAILVMPMLVRMGYIER